MPLQSKTTVYLALAGVLALMGGIIYYASLDNIHLEQAEIELKSVEFKSVDKINNQAEFDVVFLVKNPSDKTFTVAVINYQLYADDKTLLGSGLYSAMDIAMPGRAIFYSGAQVPLTSTFTINKSDTSSEIYEALTNNVMDSFMAEGMLTIQTSWSTVDKEFRTGF